MILSIQYLRAIAVILVVLNHIIWKNIQAGGSSMQWWHDAGSFGVDIFFIISGYIMVYITQNMHKKPNSVRVFLKKRFIRIIPLYWFYTLIALSIFILLPERVNSSGGDTEILKSFLLLTLGANEHYLVGPGWTLHDEFLFYIVFSFGLLLNKKVGIITVIAILLFPLFLTIFFSTFISTEQMSYYVDNFLNKRFVEFAFGMLLYFLLLKFKKIHWTISLLSLATGSMLFYHLYSGGRLIDIYHIEKGVSAFLLCFGVISLEYFWKKRECKFLTLLGNASYSIYLSHPFVLVAVLMANTKFQNIIPQNELVLMALMLIFSLFSGYISYLFIENRLIQWTKKLFT